MGLRADSDLGLTRQSNCVQCLQHRARAVPIPGSFGCLGGLEGEQNPWEQSSPLPLESVGVQLVLQEQVELSHCQQASLGQLWAELISPV